MADGDRLRASPSPNPFFLLWVTWPLVLVVRFATGWAREPQHPVMRWLPDRLTKQRGLAILHRAGDGRRLLGLIATW
jgi:hypothetical protein